MSQQQRTQRAVEAQERAAGSMERAAAGMEKMLADERRRRRERDDQARRRDQRVGHVSEPTTFNALHMCQVVHGLAGALPTIPDEFWSRDDKTVIVCCPCGATTELEPGPLDAPGTLVTCGGEECGRTYTFTGNAVRVFSEHTVAAFVKSTAQKS